MTMTAKREAAASAKETAANEPKRQGQTGISNECLQGRFDREALNNLRHRLPEYLAALGVELRRNGTRLVASCPMHEDRHPSFAVFAGGTACGCYPCGHTGDVFATAIWLGRASTFADAVKHVSSVLGAAVACSPAPIVPRPPRPATPPAITDEDRERIHLARLRFSDALHAGDPIVSDIAASLGVPVEALRWAAHGDSGLAIDAPSGGRPWLCYAYPHGLKYRNPAPEARPRFRWICGRATEPWRMGWARRPEVQTVFLTEGESDTLALIAAGLEADGTAAAVASPGTSFQAAWAPLFRGKRVVLCFDLDGPGTAAAATVAAILKGHAREILRWKGVIAR